MARQQLPPQIKKIELAKKERGKNAIRYQLTVDTGVDPITGRRKQLRKRFTTEADARDELARIQNEVQRGTFVHSIDLTVEQACANWLLSRHGIKPTTKVGYEDVLKPVRSELGDISVQKLTRLDIDKLIKELREGKLTRSTGHSRKKWGPRTCNLMVGTLSQVLEQLVKEGQLVRNVAALVDHVPQTRKQLQTLTADEVQVVLGAIKNDRLRHVWHLALSGLRRGELGGLRWADVDLENRTLRIGPTRVSAGGEAIDQEDAKSTASGRTLPLPQPLADELKAAKRQQAAEKLAFGEGYGDGGYVACNEAGQPLHPDTLTKRWKAILADLDVSQVRLHDARHTCGTLMHLQGVPIAVIAAWLGHADSSFTMRTYTHSQTDALAAAATSLGSLVTIRDSEPKSS
jgi:integrase